ncbi:MAG: TldD/PmbA family protein [Bacillota bacterium]|jgi:TldD protein|nr:TldD/PmbA family protein [Bacillota bacterium]MDY0118590.1 TldD/PmbA family protein [Bacilli bacterium]HOF65387.1 TldD/PmbA family protein [Bacilli bacterium]
MISKKVALEVLNIALETGGDFAEIFLEETLSSAVIVESGKTQPVASNLNFGAGIRILKGLQSVYGHTNNVTKKGLTELARSLSVSFKGERLLEVEKIKKVRVNNKHKIEQNLYEVPIEDVVNPLKEADQAMRDYSPQIVRTQAGITREVRKIAIFNSEGKQIEDTQQRIRTMLFAIAMAPNAFETSYYAPGSYQGFEFLKTLDLKAEAIKVAELAVRKLDAAPCPSGKMPVVIGNGFGGVIFHEACGHSLEATSVSKNLSVFSNKLGEQIANKAVTAIDDGTLANEWGSNAVDDEGFKTKKNVLIKNGILKNYLIDQFGGRRMNMEQNGASRRQSYEFEPTSRMSNTYIAPGKYTPEEIIASVKLGLYAKSMGGGSVNPATGEFNFACDEAYIIRDGKIAELVKGATLIGTGAEILLNIDMVANDLKHAAGMCGSMSGNVPVNVGQPTIRVSEILVGGQGGKLE